MQWHDSSWSSKANKGAQPFGVVSRVPFGGCCHLGRRGLGGRSGHKRATMGMLVVAFLAAASTAGVDAKMTVTLRRTKSAMA